VILARVIQGVSNKQRGHPPGVRSPGTPSTATAASLRRGPANGGGVRPDWAAIVIVVTNPPGSPGFSLNRENKHFHQLLVFANKALTPSRIV